MEKTTVIHLGAWTKAAKIALGEGEEATTRFFASRGLVGRVPVSQGVGGDGEVQVAYQALAQFAGRPRSISGLLRFRENGDIFDNWTQVDRSAWLMPSVGSTRLFIQLAFGEWEFSYKPAKEAGSSCFFKEVAECYPTGFKPDGYETRLLGGAEQLYQCLVRNKNDEDRCATEAAAVVHVKEAEKKRRNDESIASISAGVSDALGFADRMITWAEKEDAGPGGIDPDDIRSIQQGYLGRMARYSGHSVEEALQRKNLAVEMIREMAKEEDTGWEACLSLGRCTESRVSTEKCGYHQEGSIGKYVLSYNGAYLKEVTRDTCTDKEKHYTGR